MAIRLIPEVLAPSTGGRVPAPRKRGAMATVPAEAWNERVERLWYVGFCDCSGSARAFGQRVEHGTGEVSARCDRCGRTASARVRWAAVPVAA